MLGPRQNWGDDKQKPLPPDLRLGVFHTHPDYQLQKFITLDLYKLLA